MPKLKPLKALDQIAEHRAGVPAEGAVERRSETEAARGEIGKGEK